MARAPLVLLALVTLFCTLGRCLYATPRHNGEEDALVERDTKPLLRIMPLGASLTFGYKSSEKNGYRKALRQQLRYAGWEVHMVGSLKIGTMKDNENEGHYAHRIDEVSNDAEQSLALQPNLILLNAGTNDGLQSDHVDTAGDRINDLLTKLFNTINGTTVILSTLIPNNEQPKNIDAISAQYRTVAARRRAQGDRVVLAEMSYFVNATELVDGIHPDDYGYLKMASIWWAAIQEAEREGMLQPVNGGVNATTPRMEDLDDSTDDPKLPDYTAPAQPTDTSAGKRLSVGSLLTMGMLKAGIVLLFHSL